MKPRKYIALGTSILMSTAILATLATPAAHAESPRFSPIWSDTSALLNQSTKALDAGQRDQAARLAEAAMNNKLSFQDGFIADHNLCVALVGQDTERAEPHCRNAMNAPARMVVKPVDGMLKIRSGRANFVRSIGARTLSSVVGQNIRGAYTGAPPQIADAAGPQS